ncbi:MAG: respiratory nitrate reductase subunit gamma [Gammaproteobacteria bacterium]|nr:respiratory nitrate reductase subunit gamma [Gammaproteobacteria bacterium]
MTFNFLLFGVYPYVAVAIAAIGAWARFDMAQYTWKAHSSQMLSNDGMRVASNLFHVGVIFVLAGHFVGLLTPEWLYHSVITTQNKQLLAMVSGGFFGVLGLIGLTMLIKRRMNNERIKANTSKADMLVLGMLWVQLVLGLLSILVSSTHLDGSVMVQLATWAQSIVILNPTAAAESIESVNIIYKLHIILGLGFFVVFPFTRLVHVVSAPVWYFGRAYQIVRQKREA